MRNIRLFLVVFATIISAFSLSAQSITPAPAIVRGGVCDGEVCVPATPFDYTQPFKLSFEGADAVDIERLTSAVMSAEGGFHKAKLPSSSGNLALNQTGGAEMREKITLACTECKQRNYDSKKNKKNTPDRLELNKYCRFCRKHTLHKETK